jgi:hypothetical protein
MHNVLKVYTSQLSKCRAPIPGSLAVRKPTSDVIDISAEGRRQNIIERIASDIVARIRNGGTRKNSETKITENRKEESKGPGSSPNKRKAQFVYNVIRGEAEKKTNTLSVEDADFLARRFEELVRKMMDRGAHSSSV